MRALRRMPGRLLLTERDLQTIIASLRSEPEGLPGTGRIRGSLRKGGGDMNYFIEGLQGSGKSTLVRKLRESRPGYTAVMEGDYSPVELAWCAYMDAAEYDAVLRRYPDIRSGIERKTFAEGEKRIVCYTQVRTDDREFYRDLERYEIYNGRIPFDDFRAVVLGRYRRWDTDRMIFECSLFQNTVEDMLLFRCMPDGAVVDFYRQVRSALEGKDYRIVCLRTDNVPASLQAVRKERCDADGNEVWFSMLLQYFDASPLATEQGVRGEEALVRHLEHRQRLEMRICAEVFPDRCRILSSRGYTDADIAAL